ncbi:MAG: IMP dehydrogenase [bacterium]
MKKIEEKFDFNDILIMPDQKTDINSRYNDVILPKMLPLFTAPMDTVVNLSNAEIFSNKGINITLPRTVKYDDFLDYYNENNNKDVLNMFVSFGLDEITEYYKNNFNDLHLNAKILIDVANGHMQKIVDVCREIKRLRPDIVIMVGNIGNAKTYDWYVKNKCVDYIRVGIGNGNGCLTTKQSGIGHPMGSLIKEIREIKDKYESKEDNKYKLPAIVADGGMKDYSDIIKALALGADYVMVGSLFNKMLESCADNYFMGIKINKKVAKYLFEKKLPIKKKFRGMSTKQAQKAMGKTKFKTSEGVVRIRKVEYKLGGWVDNFTHYLRNSMSYSNSKKIDDFIGKANFIKISKNSYDRFDK